MAERLCVDTDLDNWNDETEKLMEQIQAALNDGQPRAYHSSVCGDFKIIPYKKADLPPVNEKSLKVYGDFKDLIRARVAAI